MIKPISVTFRVLVCLMLNFTQGIAGELAGYRVGEAVQLKINDSFWQDCVVSENPPEGITRVNCTEFREPAPGAYSRAGGTYIVYGASELRRPGTAATSSVQNVRSDVVTSSPTDASPGQVSTSSRVAEAGSLRIGEYACYGSGGSILAGLGFKALPNGRYTDLDGIENGAYEVSGNVLRFTGGHLDGQEGRDLNAVNSGFRIGKQATCEPW